MTLAPRWISDDYTLEDLVVRRRRFGDPARVLRDLPSGERWLQHLTEDLMPFWMMPTALGEPLGNFPTYRHCDGSLVDPRDPGPEFSSAVPGIVFLGDNYRDHVRAKSRQIYCYGVAYHMTGDETYLQYAVAGADYLLDNAFDEANGGAYSYFSGNARIPGPPLWQRTSQDLAYSLTGIAFLYYLTREQRYEQVLLSVHDHIFRWYYDYGADLMRWVLEDSTDNPPDTPDQKELVAQLDQIYAYMLLVAPVLPQEPQQHWRNDLKMLSRELMIQFYAPSTDMLWGAITRPQVKRLTAPHTDFGHSVKSFWLISLIGRLVGDYEMFTAAQRRAAHILDRAYILETRSWARAVDDDGYVDKDKEWWICCELDQVAGALALNDPTYAHYLHGTYDYWFRYMVDHEHHEVFHMVSHATNRPVAGFPKQHSWKNALHTSEHALVGYLVARQLRQQPVELYFASQSELHRWNLRPYFYKGSIADVAQSTLSDGRPRQKVSFVDVH